MKKIAKILLPLALCFVLLAGCGKKVEWANPEDYQDHPYQELSLGELADPERIVLAKNGREKSVFEKGSDEYEHLTTMIRSLIDTELDRNEQIEELGRKLDQTMLYMKLDEGTYLIYEYPADSYAPVYFSISDYPDDLLVCLASADPRGCPWLTVYRKLLLILRTHGALLVLGALGGGERMGMTGGPAIAGGRFPPPGPRRPRRSPGR